MVIAPAVITALGFVTSIAVVVAVVQTRRARAVRALLRATEARQRESLESDHKMEAISRVAADIAHHLNDLLTAISGHTELLIASLDPAGAGMLDAQEIRRVALSAARLTKPLRALTGSPRLSTEVIDVNAVIARTAQILRGMLGSKIEVTLVLDPTIKRGKIAAYHLEEILLNFVVHARGAMPDGGRLTVVTATISPAPQSEGRQAPLEYVRIVVGDSGGGMSADLQSKLFEPFLADGGNGSDAMGLAKVEAIVKQAGGRIQVESTPGVGTTFTFDLPASSEPASASAPVGIDTRAAPPVLVVEDEPGVREFIKLVLVRAGHEVVAVGGPHAALAALRRDPAIPLMLVDVVMPEMDGYDLVTEARVIAPGTRVVFMSAFAADKTRHPSGDGFLAKPFTVESLTTIVGAALHSP
jgi:two-component system cell cycle sensor histidine kinase/response regulator CckA